ncbi:MAG: glycosyltransferase [Candidatus Erginobacter occultus]|nr:glycosyltransferase [Candidatus Erginobacter occultus]
MKEKPENRNSPLVSVIIPAWNCEGSLERALRSVREQTYRPLEISVVNDGSTDGTDGVVRRFLTDRPGLEVAYSVQDNQGASAARNAAVAASRGELLCFLDADDTLDPECVRVLVDYHRSYPEAGVISGGCRCREYDASGRLFRRGVFQNPALEFLPPERAFPTLFVRNLLGMISVLVRRDVFERSGGFDSALSNCVDLDFWLRISPWSAFLLVPEVLGTVEKSPSGLTRDSGGISRNMLKVLFRHRRELFREHPRQAAAIFRRARATAHLLSFACCRPPARIVHLLGLLLTAPSLVFSRPARKRLYAYRSTFRPLPLKEEKEEEDG